MKTSRLKGRESIRQLLNTGKRYYCDYFNMIYALKPEQHNVAFTVVTGKRYFSNSVNRNRTKRILRQAFRDGLLIGKCSSKIYSGNYLLIYRKRRVPCYHNLKGKISNAFRKLHFDNQ